MCTKQRSNISNLEIKEGFQKKNGLNKSQITNPPKGPKPQGSKNIVTLCPNCDLKDWIKQETDRGNIGKFTCQFCEYKK